MIKIQVAIFMHKNYTSTYSHKHKYTNIFLPNNDPLSYVYCKIPTLINKVAEDFFIPQM